jgi:hypothetical protein
LLGGARVSTQSAVLPPMRRHEGLLGSRSPGADGEGRASRACLGVPHEVPAIPRAQLSSDAMRAMRCCMVHA